MLGLNGAVLWEPWRIRTLREIQTMEVWLMNFREKSKSSSNTLHRPFVMYFTLESVEGKLLLYWDMNAG